MYSIISLFLVVNIAHSLQALFDQEDWLWSSDENTMHGWQVSLYLSVNFINSLSLSLSQVSVFTPSMVTSLFGLLTSSPCPVWIPIMASPWTSPLMRVSRRSVWSVSRQHCCTQAIEVGVVAGCGHLGSRIGVALRHNYLIDCRSTMSCTVDREIFVDDLFRRKLNTAKYFVCVS